MKGKHLFAYRIPHWDHFVGLFEIPMIVIVGMLLSNLTQEDVFVSLVAFPGIVFVLVTMLLPIVVVWLIQFKKVATQEMVLSLVERERGKKKWFVVSESEWPVILENLQGSEGNLHVSQE